MVSEKDIEYVKENYLKITTKEIANHINKSIWTVYEIAKKLDIGNFKWTEEKIKILKEYYIDEDWDFLFNALGTNKKTVILDKACSLGLHKRVIWNEEYDIAIKKYYPSCNFEEIFSRIPNLTRSSMQHRAIKLGIGCDDHYWSDEELELFNEKYPYYPNQYLSDVFFPKRNAFAINQMAMKLNLKKDSSQNNKSFVHDKMIKDLAELGEKLGHAPLVDELALYNLPSSKSYDRYFGSYTKACGIAGLEINISLWGNAKIFFSKNNDVCFSMSELVITNFLIDNKIPYKKEKAYSEICDDLRCGMKRMDWWLDNNYVLEYWGYPKVKDYKEGVLIKQSICLDNNLNIIELTRKDIRKLPDVFKYFINKYL
jgi:hypothetical protein